MNRNLRAHKLVREVAIGFASALYSEIMQDNSRYASWKAMCPDLNPEWLERKFVQMTWPTMIERARATLAGMLRNPGMSYEQKDLIADALVKDNSMRLGKVKTRVLH